MAAFVKETEMTAVALPGLREEFGKNGLAELRLF